MKSNNSMREQKETGLKACKFKIRAIHDVLYIIGGKWKISIIACLCYGNKRYSDLLDEVEGISGKMLSRELKEMEANNLVRRTVLDIQPIGVEYSLTAHGRSIKPIIDVIADWGNNHRDKILKENPS
ncbi:HxlR family transcriptional regulator [Gillisia sp. Hel_I_86]|uniref:winged helix-turn-helix transcriptional regulator n=1 Tax=Flavobacteriaceae TaxID=49546 RepID=UPI00119B51DA|nr:helix-turn-helix domain-containing protein [Gillisia sp. Hel_I_86]TVZ26713.1 HxlR family transcriptional regulator [Gillisia sp. Hel_I_86]